MKNIVTYVGVMLSLTSMPVWAASSPEFQQLKQLVGKWEGTSTPMGADSQHKAGPVATEFRLTAAGTAVEETLMKGTPKEMVDMYVDENGRLALTHYCAMGNQPHMVAKPAGPNTIHLEMVPTGIAVNDNHMHSLVLETPDKDHLIERWTSYANGKPSDTVVFALKRVP